MNLTTLQKEITRLARTLTENTGALPLREAFRHKSDLGRHLLAVQEFVLEEEYTALLTDCGLSKPMATACITYMLKRHGYRWTS